MSELGFDKRKCHMTQDAERQSVTDHILHHSVFPIGLKLVTVYPQGIRPVDLYVDKAERWIPFRDQAAPAERESCNA